MNIDYDSNQYRDREVLDYLYNEERIPLTEIAERFDITQSTIHKWMDRNGIERRTFTARREDGTHRDKETLERLYVEEGMTQEEVADELGVHPPTIRRWLQNYGIEARSSADWIRKEYATFLTKSSGYETWAAREGYDMAWVYVHRLLAVAEYGFDPVVGKHVHHKNGVKWDNRPENIEVLLASDHMSLHNSGRWSA